MIFGVTATGTPTLLYQWQLNGANLLGANAATLSLPNVQPTNAGDYTVIVGNAANTVTSAVATLTVNVRPAITQQPTNIVAALGSTVTFNVAATGTAPLSYFWRLNGTPIPGARGSSLTLASLQDFNRSEEHRLNSSHT